MFKLIDEVSIDSLNLRLAQYEHSATGAKHIHLSNNQRENVFMVALRTVPSDSTGVAHILEHTALCGSKRFPVRDPFFMMLRRSLNTFMNAFTGSDWTAYPFATQNRKDFDNLLQVYLDSVFFPNLDPLDFAQEGHRLEYAAGEDKKSPALNYCGVVFNEMKGAMSSVSSQLWQSLCAEIYGTSTYKYNSGGDPADIPDLSHEQLVAFHKRYYHPSNATFMTCGDIPAAEHQERFEEKVLSQFERGDTDIIVPVEERFSAPKSTLASYTARSEDLKDDANAYLILSWLLCDNTDFDSVANMQLLNGVLLNHSASPLKHLLETTKLAKAPSSMTGLMDEHRELLFLCGVERARSDAMPEFEQEVLGVLGDVVRNGIDKSEAESVLHQYELQHREIGGGAYPYGLQLLLQCLPSVLYRGNVMAALDIDSVLRRLRKDIENPDFIPQQIQEQLLDNKHRVSLSALPDADLNERQQRQERDKLAEIDNALQPKERDNIVRLSKALQQRQENEDSPDILPRLRLNDVPDDVDSVSPEAGVKSELSLTTYKQATNGLSYQHVVLPMPAFNEDELRLWPLYRSFVSEMGVGKDDYLEMQRQQAAISGGVGCSGSIRALPKDSGGTDAHITFSMRTLDKNTGAGSALLRRTFEDVRFDETDRLRELISKARARAEENITNAGHQLAMTAACASMSDIDYWAHQNGGMPSVARLMAHDGLASDDAGASDIAKRLAQLHERVREQTPQILLVSDAGAMERGIGDVEKAWQGYGKLDKPSSDLQLNIDAPPPQNQVWRVQSQVNFCARAWKTVPYTHPDAPKLTVLGAFLRNGFLHREIRERGGAYGGGASQSGTGSFVCYSYRDPRLEETLADFNRAMDWLQSHKHSDDQLEEAILSVVGGLDKPQAPAATAISDFHDCLYGYTHDLRMKYRKAVLETSMTDLLAVGERYLTPDKAHTAVLVPYGAGEGLVAEGYEPFTFGGDKSEGDTKVA